MSEYMVIVDDNEKVLGISEKIHTHRQGMQHLAFSVFIFNEYGDLLMQKRAAGKYHCPGLWSNACCSHPRLHEDFTDAGKRRLEEEIGIYCRLDEIGLISYRFTFENGLIENEIDHILLGYYSGDIKINEEEVEEAKFVSLDDLEEDIVKNQEKYTPWFCYILPKVLAYLDEN